MAKPVRLDSELVRRGLVRSRAEARRAIDEGKVVVRDMPVAKAASLVSSDASIAIAGEPRRFVSRGGDKLDGALARLGIRVEGRRWLDAGASTGGFTDRLLQGGAVEVVALDVGYGQLDWELRQDPRVHPLERSNVRTLRSEDLPWPPEGVVADLSFISLTLVLPALRRVATADADFLLLVKPQFEAGREAVGSGGVVTSPGAWRDALVRVAGVGRSLGLGIAGATPSYPPGPAGNREFFLHLQRDGSEEASILDRAVSELSP